VFNRGEMVRDFTYVDDIVEGVIRVMGKPAAPAAGWSGDHPDPATSYAPGVFFNIGNNQRQLMRYIEVLEQCLGRKAKLDLLPMQPGDVPATFADVAELHKASATSRRLRSKSVFRRFAEWYQDFYRKSCVNLDDASLRQHGGTVPRTTLSTRSACVLRVLDRAACLTAVRVRVCGQACIRTAPNP